MIKHVLHLYFIKILERKKTTMEIEMLEKGNMTSA